MTGLFIEKIRTACKIQRCCVLLVADGIKLPPFGEKGCSRAGLSNAWPAMLSRVARVEIKVAEKLYRRTQSAFLFNLLVFFRASKCIYLCI